MKSSLKSQKRVNNYDVYPKGGVAQTIMYQNMSSHYRRIYNVKPRIDTGPPFSHRPVKAVSPRPFNWIKKQNQFPSPTQSQSSLTLSSSKCSRKRCGEQPMPTFKPQISKVNVESKLRNLRDYHAPRRRVYTSASNTSLGVKESPKTLVPEIAWITSDEEMKNTPSKGSTSDSAYTEEGEIMWSQGESREPTPVSDSMRAISSESLLYVKFVRGITDEVLRKGVFTNKGLKKIFQSHIDVHKDYLNLRKMQEEVEKLQMELGVPKEEDKCIEYSLGFPTSTSEEKDKLSLQNVQDKELMDALMQLDISHSLKADIANSLGLYSRKPSSLLNSVNNSTSYKPSSSYSSRTSCSSSSELQLPHSNTKRPTFSSSLEVIHDTSSGKKEKFGAQQKFPQSDSDSYEMLSEGSVSRPLTPLGMAW